MGGFSSVDPTTKMELHELLSRWCWSIDHLDLEEWEQLFTIDARYTIPGMDPLEGREAILSVPQRMRDKSDGNWRHHFTNVIVDRAASGREMKLRAFLTIRDCLDATPVASADCVIVARRTDHWRIACFEAASVCKGAALPRPTATVEMATAH
jgi:hypothetical protein